MDIRSDEHSRGEYQGAENSMDLKFNSTAGKISYIGETSFHAETASMPFRGVAK